MTKYTVDYSHIIYTVHTERVIIQVAGFRMGCDAH
eukprot:COSAG02_NODE_62871_length_264_cov_1.563636_1_plen_34_part_10